jgi:hypothetical protein
MQLRLQQMPCPMHVRGCAELYYFTADVGLSCMTAVCLAKLTAAAAPE